MKLENNFDVGADADRVWELLLDVPRVVPCMPGAELLDSVGADEWKARMRVKLGPVGLVFDTTVVREEVDEPARRVRLAANAREQKGRGAARATIESSVTPTAAGSTVSIVTDVTLSGTVAQYGRSVVHDVSAQLVDRFAKCLEQTLAATPPAAAPAPAGGGAAHGDDAAPTAAAHGDLGAPAAAGPGDRETPRAATAQPAAPIGGLRLLLRALTRLFRRSTPNEP
jgi:carbon monoxide dehydrogenase subunit G